MDVIYNFMLENFSLLFSLFLLAIALGVMFTLIMGLTRLINSYLIPKIFPKFFKKKLKSHTHILGNDTIKNINKLNEQIAVLRGELDADRSYIFEFHNGQIFASNNPRWKMSQTYEKVKPGISYEGSRLQNLEVTLYWEDFIKMFFTQNENNLPKGISIDTMNNSNNCSTNCFFPRRLYFIKVLKMDYNEGPSKVLLEQKHVYYMLVSPIINNDNMPLGFIGVDFCSENDIDKIKDPNFKACNICKLAASIASEWDKDLDSVKDKSQKLQKDFWLKY